MNATVSAEIYRKVYKTGNMGANFQVDNFHRTLVGAGFYQLTTCDKLGDGAVAYYSTDNVSVGIEETTSPSSEPVNEFTMTVVTANPSSERAAARINALETALSMFKPFANSLVPLRNR